MWSSGSLMQVSTCVVQSRLKDLQLCTRQRDVDAPSCRSGDAPRHRGRLHIGWHPGTSQTGRVSRHTHASETGSYFGLIDRGVQHDREVTSESRGEEGARPMHIVVLSFAIAPTARVMRGLWGGRRHNDRKTTTHRPVLISVFSRSSYSWISIKSNWHITRDLLRMAGRSDYG